VGVVSRGHGRRHGQGDADEGLAVSARSTAADVGDEPLLIHRRTGAPVFVARRRARAAQALLQAHPGTQLLICDDGLQHLALARDLTLCVFDERGLGNGWLLPAGPLREPWPVAVDWCVQIGEADQAVQAVPGAFAATRSLAGHAVDGQGRQVPLAALQGRPVVAFAGIAKPEVFFAALRAQGLAPAREIALGDHADPLGHPALASLLEDDAALLLCTEKDAVKLWPRFPHVLAVPLHLALPPALLAEVDARVDALLAAL
jgi:tetraacyldisaccharide 4'-kinase